MPQLPEVRVALAGLGTVGSAAARLLLQERARYEAELGISLRLISVLDRSHKRKDTTWLGSDVLVTGSLDEFLQGPAEIVVETIGGTEPANQIIRTSLTQRKAVVTANKLLMARCGEQFLKLADENNSYLGFEACVAGGIPIIRVLQRCLFADRIVRLRGILNGTCNFILSQMDETGRDFEDILGQAQALGYAEADPTLDVSGRDARDKLAILSALAFGAWIKAEEIATQGITEILAVDFLYARKLGATIKLLGVAESRNQQLTLRVSPFLAPTWLPIAKISGVLNAVEVTGQKLGSTVFSGRGAGGDPTGVSVVADILNAALAVMSRGAGEREGGRAGAKALAEGAEPKSEIPHSVGGTSEKYPFYLRFFVKDRPGIIAALAGILARSEINIDSVIQEHWPESQNLPFIITVEPTPFPTLQSALAEMAQLDFNNLPPLAMPMLVE